MRKKKQAIESEEKDPAVGEESTQDANGASDPFVADPLQESVLDSEADGDPDGEQTQADVPENEIQRISSELEEQKENYLRLAAEFDNFRKRVERQRNEIRQNARSEIVRSILETLDNLSRVTNLSPADAGVEDVIAGVQMVERSLLRELETAGLVSMGNENEPFDPNDHEAVATAPAPDEEMVDHIAAVLQVGYRFGGTLLRPARVQVYVAPAQEDD